MNYYNEIDPNAAAWLRGLISEGLIPAGEVDERSIVDVSPTDVLGFTQCHFFAGIGGWSLALQLAGWPPDRPVWTGSCPCQPFSSAGKQMGRKDPRHLWPTLRRLINRCRPPVVFGEQVASADGRRWLTGVFSNLETMGFAPAGLDLCAAGVTAPHIRQRLWWLGERLADPDGQEHDRSKRNGNAARRGGSADSGRLGNAHNARPQGHHRDGDYGNQSGWIDPEPLGSAWPTGQPADWLAHAQHDGRGTDKQGRGSEGRAAYCGDRIWNDASWHLCRDGKYRRVPTEPALFPLADGLPYKLARRGSVRPAILKGAGNAIVPQVAAEFIRAYLEIEKGGLT